MTKLVTLLVIRVTVVVSGHGLLVTKLLSTLVVSVHSLAVSVVSGNVLVSVHVDSENVGTVVVRVSHTTVVVVRSKGTDFVAR